MTEEKRGGQQEMGVIVMFVIRFLVEFNKCVGKREREKEREVRRGGGFVELLQ
jgi:hypothetical protein